MAGWGQWGLLAELISLRIRSHWIAAAALPRFTLSTLHPEEHGMSIAKTERVPAPLSRRAPRRMATLRAC
jgi:hypothetical protein